MEKEKLTKENIHNDLRCELKNDCIGWIVAGVLIAFLMLVFVRDFDRNNPIFAWVLFVVFLPSALFVGWIRDGLRVLALYRTLKNPLVIQEEGVLETKVRRNRYGVSHYLYFERSGKFMIPLLNYTWSTYKATDRAVYESTQQDDTFYLVLSKPEKGRILLAYNKRLFQLEEQI